MSSENSEKKEPIEVLCRIVFLKVGEVDTKNENFHAHVFIEAIWEDDSILPVLNEENISIDQFEYNPKKYWSPKIFVENGVGEFREDKQYRLSVVDKLDQSKGTKTTVQVTELIKLRGVFYERLELDDFPIDQQELSVRISSKKSIDEVLLKTNKISLSAVDTDEFQDQQQWDLFDTVKIAEENVEDPFRKYTRSVFKVSAYVVRKPGYYLNNAFLLIFLITALGFTAFAFPPLSPQFRCQVTGLLLLTEVNFRWVITQRLPAVSYLTVLDKYAIGCLIHLIIFAVWHALIGSQIIYTDMDRSKQLDYILLYFFAGIFAAFNITFIIWFIKLKYCVHLVRKEHLTDSKAREEYRDNYLAEEEKKRAEIEASQPDAETSQTGTIKQKRRSSKILSQVADFGESSNDN